MISRVLLGRIREDFRLNWHGIHGVSHRARVRLNGWLRGIQPASLELVIISKFHASGRAFSLFDGSKLMSLAASDPWPQSPVAGSAFLIPISSWEMMLEETRATCVEFDGFWLDRVEAGVAYFFQWLGEPRSTVLVVWDDRTLTCVECRGVGDRDLAAPESDAIAQFVLDQFAAAGYALARK